MASQDLVWFHEIQLMLSIGILLVSIEKVWFVVVRVM